MCIGIQLTKLFVGCDPMCIGIRLTKFQKKLQFPSSR
jgi:hypothetical protein